MTAEWLSQVGSAVNFANIQLVSIRLVKFVPDGSKSLAMTTPWCVEFNEPGFVRGDSVSRFVNYQFVEVLLIQIEWFNYD